MTALLLFVGVVIGVAITIIVGLVIVHWPEPKLFGNDDGWPTEYSDPKHDVANMPEGFTRW